LFGRVRGQSAGDAVGGRGFLVAAEAAQQVGAGRVEQVVAVQPRRTQVVHRRQARRRAADLGQRDGAVERDDRRGRERVELVVERQDGGPVGAVIGEGEGMDRVDRGLNLVRARLAALDARTDDGLALGDQLPVPQPPVLFGQPDQPAVGGDAGGPAGVQQQQQRQQTLRLRFVRHQPGQHPGEPDSLGAQVKPHQRPGGGCVALVEDQVDDREDRREAAGKL
jgi:hypothetical protein